MLPGHDQYGIIISKLPVMQSGLKTITSECLPDYIFRPLPFAGRNSR
ncbi:Uncharacterised protein [Raoultella planticola]|uniref:Uncharacterized protein n=1 Tax=Raoultella planticola TaxID=575 RepID=A0A485AZ96_RAOPL|nr:Uncharacterised protein [Raoultella planticola]